MHRNFGFVCLVILMAAALSLGTSCKADILTQLMVPEGNLIPDTGYPLGVEGGGGGGGFAYDYVNPLPAFSVDNLPTVEYWNQLAEEKGELANYPNPFIFADGSVVQTPEDWPRRRAEIMKIIEYYWSGELPPPPDKVEISGAGATGAGSVTIEVTANGRTASFSVTITLPTLAPNGLPPSPTNKVPVLLVSSGGGTPANYGYASISCGSSDSLSGIAMDLYQWDASDPGRPSSLTRNGWRIGRILDALELGAGGGVIDPRMAVTCGMSRNGKDALFMGLYGVSMTGTRVAVTCPVSSGSAGIAPDRFVAQAGGKPSYFYRTLDTITSNLVQIITEAEGGIDAGRTNHGFQTLPHVWTDSSGVWLNIRNRSFTDMHKEWICNYQSTSNPGDDPNSWHGYEGSAPFDAHFLAALAAPYGLLIFDGWDSAWTNAEGNYMVYLAGREVYDFLGVSENIGIRIYKIGHSFPTREVNDIIDFSNLYFNRTFGTDWVRTSDVATYPVNPQEAFNDADPKYLPDAAGQRTLATWFDPDCTDPEGRHEYLKLNWAAPGKPKGSSVADKVKAYFDAERIPYIQSER
jgi:hypothetical protein